MLNTTIEGQLLVAKTASFKDDKQNEVFYGKIQILTRDQSGEFYALQNIKVKSDRFNDLAPLSKNYLSKNVKLGLIQSSYNGKVSYYFDRVITD